MFQAPAFARNSYRRRGRASAVHIQQNGIYVLPGNVDMHREISRVKQFARQGSITCRAKCYSIRLSEGVISCGFRQLSYRPESSSCEYDDAGNDARPVAIINGATQHRQ